MTRKSSPGWRRSSVLAPLLVLAMLAFFGSAAFHRYMGRYGDARRETFVEVQHGMSTGAIGRLLERQGVIRSSWAFLFERLLHPAATLQAGEYKFVNPATPADIFKKIQHGEIFYEDFTVPEGSNLFDIADLLRNSDTVSAESFIQAASDPQSVRDLDPAAPSLEGFLFPSTYRVTHKTTASQLCREMTATFRKELLKLAPAKSEPNLHIVLTLASLVEREAAVAGERSIIAGVFRNRLRLNMPLQCDPTTVYAALLEKRFRGVIHKSDLASTNPYNTYAHAGLPPGPICNPGIASLKAALQPARHNYLYFVATADQHSSHHFSATLTEHLKAVAAYRKAVATY